MLIGGGNCDWRRRWRHGVCVLVLAVAVAPLGARRAWPAAARASRIVVLAEAWVDGEVIRLGDVAHLDGPLVAGLGSLEVGRAPAPGAVRSLSGEAILARLGARGVDLEKVRYRIPSVVRVRRRAQEVSAATVRAIVETYLADTVTGEGAEIRVRSVEVPRRVRLPVGPYSTRVTRLGPPATAGVTRMRVEFLQHGHVVAAVDASARVAVFGTAYVTRRAVARGTIIARADIMPERRDLATLPRGVITREADAVGKQARVGLPPMAPLRRDQLGFPTVVHRGDVVILLAESAGLMVTTKGEVREDAARDAQVRVRNLSSRKEVIGRVVDENTVVVAF